MVRFRQSERGEAYFDFIVKFVITMCVAATFISFYDIYVKHQNVVAVAKRVTRAIEISGANNATVTALFNQLCADMKMSGATFNVVNVSYFPGGVRRIQLRDSFTVVVTYPMQLRMARIGNTPLGIPITLEAKLGGMSEVYWR